MNDAWVRCFVVGISAAFLASTVSCKDDAAAGSNVCDPLATKPPKTIELGKILGVGRDDDGTLYVVDNVEGEFEPRVFIAEQDVLIRHRVAGSGDGVNHGVRFMVLSVEADPEILTLAIEITASETRMATVAGATKAPSFDELEDRHALEVLDASVAEALTARDLSDEVEIEYVAKAKGGELMLVIRPRDNWDYDDFRVFYGKPPQLLERHVGSVTRALDGGSTTIDFELDSTTAHADFPVISGADGFEPGPATVEIGGRTLALERLAAKRSALGDADLLCFP